MNFKIQQTKFIFYHNIIIITFLFKARETMKKIILFPIIAIFILSSTGTTALTNGSNSLEYRSVDLNHIIGDGSDYTHTVFLEIANTQFCGGCDFWNSDVYNIYSQGDYDFEYVNMIVYGPDGWDDILNLYAYDWNNLYNITKYPTTIMDGDYKRLRYQPYTLPSPIDECGIRPVRNIKGNMSLLWLENATIKIDISIDNNEDIQYNGYIRVAITEISSRYNTVNDSKFHFGFLDYAFYKDIFISDSDIYTDSIIWNGNEHMDNHGNNFGDIHPGNIQVVMGVYNYDNYYLDETVKAFIFEPPYAPDIEGPTSGKVGVEYNYSFVAVDPEDNSIFYYVDWGDETFEDWFGPYSSGKKVTIRHNWTTKGIFNIRARAKTIYGKMGQLGEFKVKIPRERISIYNCLLRFLEKIKTLEVVLRVLKL